MPIVQPTPPRYSVETLGSSVRITIPSRKNWFAIPLLSFWLIAWAVGEIIVCGILIAGIISVLRSSEPSGIGSGEALGIGVFVLAWLGLWTAGGAFVMYALFWQLKGKELIEVNPDSITIRRKVFGIGRSKTYLAEHIKDLRVSPAVPHWFGWSSAAGFWGLPNGMIAFDYGAKTIRFGSGVDEAEAKQIIRTIQQHLPQIEKG